MAHISLLTLGVDDVTRATQFYEAVGWERSPASVDGVVTFLRGGAVVLGLFGRAALAEDADLAHPGADDGPAVACAMNLPTEDAVAEALAGAERAGARITKPAHHTDWGGYSGYFVDPDGHLWEVATNPGFDLLPDGRVLLPATEADTGEVPDRTESRPPLRLPAWFDTDGLTLRPPTEADVERIAAICQDPDIQHFTRVPVPYTHDDAASFVSMATDALEQGSGAHLLVEHGGEVAGCVGASIDATDQLALIGYWTAPEARGRGITTRAVRRLCRWMLDDVGMARLELYAAASNPGSNAVAARLGFRLEGTRRSAVLLSEVGDRAAVRVDANDWGLLPGELR